MRLLDWLLSWWKSTELDEELQKLERGLQDKLVLVEPRPQFVYDLRQNLLRKTASVEPVSPRTKKHQVFQTGLLVTSGILGSIVVVIAGIRGVVSLVGAVGLLISLIRHDSQKPIQTSNLSPN